MPQTYYYILLNNLQTYCCACDTKHLQTDDSFTNFRAKIICEQPTADLYTFVGNIEVHSQSVDDIEKSVVTTTALTSENVLLRGSRLKNTPYIYG